MIPPMDALGLLPAGIHDCTLADAEPVFCRTPHRRTLWDGLQRFIAAEVRPLGPLALWIDGSFTRAKDYPDDVDVLLDLSAWDESRALAQAFLLLLNHDKIKQAYHVDAWAQHPVLPNDMTAFFQYVGEKCAAELRIDKRHPKGILRVQT